MSDLSFEQMLEDSFKNNIHTGEVVTGTVISVKPDSIVLNIGYKSDGIISRDEYTSDSNLDLTTVVKEGDEITAKILRINDGDGYVALSYKRLAAEAGSKRLEEAFENQEVLTGKVNQVLEGGLTVIIDETKVFIPASLVSDVYEKDLSKYKDQEIEFVITEFNPRKRRIIGDRRQLLTAKKEAVKTEVLGKISEGQVVEGTVKNVTDFGAFVDIGGIDGLLHVSEISWGRVTNPKKIFKPGDQVKAFIREIDGDKVSLSLKFDDQNPWLDAETKYAVGTIVKGKVARFASFGAFIALEDGIDGLVHVSQIAKHRVEKPQDELSIGQEVEAKVIALDLEGDKKKISLSIADLLPDEEPAVSAPAEALAEAAAEEPAVAEDTVDTEA